MATAPVERREGLFELLRFGLVSVAGLAVDLSIGWTLAVIAGLPLALAAIIGFAAGAGFNYLLHELWTFRHGERKLSSRRATQYFLLVGLVLAARLAGVFFLAVLLPGGNFEFVILAGATGFSFIVNFVASRLMIFRPSAPPMAAADAELAAAGWQIPAYNEATYTERRHAHALVIPVINEGERIRAQLQRIRDARLPVDIVIADGGSTDGSLDASFVADIPVRAVLTKTGPGRLSAQLRIAYAWCLREGYEGIVTIDGNGKDSVESVTLFIDRLREGYDYVQGSRYQPGGAAENTPLDRMIGNRLVHAPMLSLASRHWLTDTTNGFRGYSRRLLTDPRVAPFRDVFVNYELLFYLSVRAGQLGYRVCEVPVRRSYPKGEATPTKIAGLSGKAKLLRQTLDAALGRFNP